MGSRIEVSSISVYLDRVLLKDVERRSRNGHFKVEEVRILEITINTGQAIAIIWTFIAIVLSAVIALEMGFPSILGTYYSSVPLWLTVAAFFGVFLVITLPVYLLVALWEMVRKAENE